MVFTSSSASRFVEFGDYLERPWLHEFVERRIFVGDGERGKTDSTTSNSRIGSRERKEGEAASRLKLLKSTLSQIRLYMER